MVGVDVGYENPMFACLEVDYEEADEDPTGQAAIDTKQTLTFYELDLCLNHVVRKYSEPLEEFANLLIPVPGGEDGPSGILVCSENFITYKNFGEQPDIRCPIPTRKTQDDSAAPKRNILIVSSAMHKFSKGGGFFFLVQTELGDIFKLDFEIDDDIVTEIKLKYFDTLSTAVALCFLPRGFLFVASEYGNHSFYQIVKLGDDEAQEFSSINYQAFADDEHMESEADPIKFQFEPRQLENLVPADEIESPSPLLACKVSKVANEDSPQIYVSCGRGAQSSIRVLRHGLKVSKMGEPTTLPGNPTGVWAIKKRHDGDYDDFIVVSFINATLVLGIGEDKVEEVQDSSFLGTKPTLCCGQVGDAAIVQVYPEGIRHIHSDKRVNEWKPGKLQIVKCAMNQRQVTIALSNREIVYFEMDVTGQLNEYNDRKPFNSNITCMALGPVPPGEQRSRFLAVGLADMTVRVLSLDPNDCMSQVAMQALTSSPESLCIAEMGSQDKNSSLSEQLYLNIGLQNGVLLRTSLDRVTGDLVGTRSRYLGSRPIKLFNVIVQQNQAVLASTSRSWLSYYYQNKFHLAPLSYKQLEYASSFSSQGVPEGVVAITGTKIRILTLEKLGTTFNQHSFTSLDGSPRKFVVHPESGNVVLLETERLSSASDVDHWHSSIKLIDPLAGQVIQTINLRTSETATSIAIDNFGTTTSTVLIGVAKNYHMKSYNSSGGDIYTYALQQNGTVLELMHVTPVEDIPQAMCPFQNRIAIGMKKTVRVYAIGKKQLLKKCENKQMPTFVSSISAHENRLFVGDAHQSMTFMKYHRIDNRLTIFADCTGPKSIICTGVVDHNTVACGDKFGNLCIFRLPESVNEDIDDDPTGVKSLWDRGWLGGSSQKAECIASFYVGEIVTSIQLVKLASGFAECLLYTTIFGSIGVLIPFTTSKEEYDFFQTLEMHMRSENSPLCGRDHLSFRSYYFPVKAVIDGDLCQQFMSLEAAKQRQIAEELDRPLSDICLLIDQLVERIL